MLLNISIILALSPTGWGAIEDDGCDTAEDLDCDGRGGWP
jgi:hypothetical protein